MVLPLVVAHSFALTHSRSRTPGAFYLENVARAFAIGLVLLCSTSLVVAAEDSFRLTDDELTARDVARTELIVDIDGRYSIAATSALGTALRLTDRTLGPGDWVGKAGSTDGRLDVHLRAGSYLIETRGPRAASGTVKLSVSRYVESAEAQPLVGSDVKSLSLPDGTARRFSVSLPEPGWLHLEAAGQALDELSVWRNGEWLVERALAGETIEPKPGAPLRRAELSARLAAGDYIIVAYGGRALKWANRAEASFPFHLRRDAPLIGQSYRGSHTIGPFGTERFKVPASSTQYNLTLVSPSLAALEAAQYQPGTFYSRVDRRAGLGPQSRQLTARVSLQSGRQGSSKLNVVTVRGAEGEPFALQTFSPRRRLNLRSPGAYLVQAYQPGEPRGLAPTSALLFQGPKGNGRMKLKDADLVALDRSSNWRARFNLNSSTQVFLRVDEANKYKLRVKGQAARLGLTPYNRPKSGQWTVRRPRDDGGLLLTPGYYRLNVEPDQPGIHELTIRGEQANPEARTMPVAARFEKVVIEQGQQAVVQLPATSDQDPALDVLKLPLDLRQPLTVVLEPQEELRVPVATARVGRLAVHSQADEVSIRTTGSSWRKTMEVGDGLHQIEIRNEGLVARSARLSFEASSSSESASLGAESTFDKLSLHDPAVIKVSPNAPTVLSVSIPKDGFYAIESDGLLDLIARLDAPRLPMVWHKSSDDSARNFTLQGPLSKGEYRLLVRARGKSQGRAVIRLSERSSQRSAAMLVGQPLRRWMNSGSPAESKFIVQEAGRYRLRVYALGGHYPFELTDSDGWPLIKPGTLADVELSLKAGAHRLRIWPTNSRRRAVAEATLVTSISKTTGHGPHVIPINATKSHRWESKGATDPSRRDVWRFSLTADTTVDISVDAGMVGELHDASGQPIGTFGTEGLRGLELPTGPYQIRLWHGAGDNRVDYKLSVRSRALLPGETRTVEVPAVVPIAAPDHGAIQIRSLGNVDVRARLVDAEGVEIAFSDDATGDWNFEITNRVKPGHYRLEVLTPGPERAQIRLVSKQEAEVAEAVRSTPVPSTPGPELVRDGDVLRLGPKARISVVPPMREWPTLLAVDALAQAPRISSGEVMGNRDERRSIIAWVNPPSSLMIESISNRRQAVRFSLNDYLPALAQTVTYGTATLNLAGGLATPLYLPPARKMLTLDLPKSVVALTSSAVLSSNSEPGTLSRFKLVTTDAKIWLFNRRRDTATLPVKVRPAPVESEGLYKTVNHGPGRLIVHETNDPASGAVDVLGKVGESRTVFHEDGSRTTSTAFEAGQMVWFESEKVFPLASPEVFTGSQAFVHTLGSRGARLVGQGTVPTFFRLNMSSPALVYEPTPHPSTRWIPATQSIQWVGLAGRTLDLKPTGSRVDLEVLKIPVSVLPFDKHTRRWLGPNESVVFRFTVKHASTYALKANVSDDLLSVVVLNSALEPVASGLNQLLKLGPGDYYIRLTRDVGLAPSELHVHLMSTPKPSLSRPLASSAQFHVQGGKK